MTSLDPARPVEPGVPAPDRPAPDSPAPDSPTPDAVGSDRWYLSAAPLVRALLHLCVPMAAAMVVGAVHSVVNAGFIGSRHDASLLAAVVLGAPVLGLVMAVGDVFGVGGGALVARLLGAAEHDPRAAARVRHVTAFALWGSVAAGAVAGGAGLLLLHPLVGLLGADPTTAAATRSFVAVLLAFVPVLAAAVCLEQLVRAQGAARQVMVGLVAATVANVVLDVLLILVLPWGVAGAALATGLANVVAVAYFAAWLTRHSRSASLSPRWSTLSGDVVRPVLGVGVGSLLQAGFLVVTSLVLNHLAAAYGEGPLAAMGVAVRIAQVPEFLVMGVTLGVLPLFAYSYGKGDGDRLSAAVRTAALAVGAVSLAFAGTAFLLRHQLIGLFASNPSVLAVGATILTAQLVAMVANGFAGLLTSLFQATGRALAATVVGVTQGVLFVPVVLLGNLWFGLPGVVWALTVTEVAVLVVGVVLWLTSRGAIREGLAAGSPQRADAALEAAG